jgi:predicted phage baseplate assembly protein
LEGARANAPNTVRTFDRVVSLEDFADMAREFAGVGKAFATWVWDGEERVVHVTVGGQDGIQLSDQQLKAIRAYLDRRRDPNRTLRIDRYRAVPFLISAAVGADPDRPNEDVRQAVVAGLLGYFAYDRRSFGQAVHLSDVYAVIHETEGVVWAKVGQLRYKRLIDRVIHGNVFDSVAVHCPILPARPHGSGQVRPAELASIESSVDVVVEVTGGLE